MKKTRFALEVAFNPSATDSEGFASALDRLLETACSTPGILDEYGNPTLGQFALAELPEEQEVVPRYVLYDFDADNLATTTVYRSYQEAADDATRLDNVIVLTLPLEM